MEKFPDSSGEHSVHLSGPPTLSGDTKVKFADASGTIPVSENYGTLEEIVGKRYIATLFQTGVSDPVATLLTPSTGSLANIAWTRVEPRIYDGYLLNGFTLDGRTELIMRDAKDLVSFEVRDVNTVRIEMTEDDTLCNRRIEINVL